MMPHTPPFPEPRFPHGRSHRPPRGGTVAPTGSGGCTVRSRSIRALGFSRPTSTKIPSGPGSLGLEAFIQLLKVYAVDRWDLGESTEFATMAGGKTTGGDTTGGQMTGSEATGTELAGGDRHRWTYRGQIIPGCERVEVFASITEVDDVHKRVRADGFLTVDGRMIYAMNDFSLGVIA